MPGIFDSFCHYVDDTIFSKENVGDTVAFIVDQAFIDDFCKKQSITEKALMQDVMLHLYRPAYYGHLQVKGILAIQLYATTKREDSGGITEKNYRDRLVEVLNWDINDLQSWMTNYQEDYWERLYNWCSVNGFMIARCSPKTGSGRYVQYPVQQAARVFTQKDLKYIAYHFVQHNLQPGEDLNESDFWEVMNQRRIASYVHTNHGKRLVENEDYLLDAYRQIFNYYLRWDGSYIDINRNKIVSAPSEKHFIYLSENGYIDVRDEDMKLEHRFQWEDLSLKALGRFYAYKRKQMIIFKSSDVYDRYWEETRFLEGGKTDESSLVDYEEGMAVVFTDSSSFYSSYAYSSAGMFSHLHPIFSNVRIKIYKFSHSKYLDSLYTERKFFSLKGGLKVGRMQFLEGGAPILMMEKESKFWIDGEEPSIQPKNGILSLNFLKVGEHDIKFPNFKRLEFSIVKPSHDEPVWEDEYNTWQLSKDNVNWTPGEDGSGVVGIDFSCFRMNAKGQAENNALTRWASFHSIGRVSPDEDNIAIRILTKR